MKEYGADVYIMMNSGADPNRKNKDGTTPLGCSIRNWQNNRHHIQIQSKVKKPNKDAIDNLKNNQAIFMKFINILMDQYKEKKDNNEELLVDQSSPYLKALNLINPHFR